MRRFGIIPVLVTMFATTSFFAQEKPGNVRAPEKPGTAAVKEQSPSDDVKILFAGDTHFLWGVHEFQAKNGRLEIAREIVPVFEDASFRVLNLETALSSRGSPVPQRAYIFNSDLENIEVLKLLKLNLTVLGNNHSMDMGWDGLEDTMKKLRESGIPSIGAGKNENDAASAYFTQIGGIKVAFFSFCDVGENDMFSTATTPGVARSTMQNLQRIRDARRMADIVIVNIHWGIEYATSPTVDQVRFARMMIDAGASAIIGHHPHIPHGVEIYRNAPIAYSLGNFIFGSINQYQTHNIIAVVDLDRHKKTIQNLRIVPVQGTFRNGGHAVEGLTYAESTEFWQEFYLQTQDLSAETAAKLKISPNGVGEITIAQD